MGVAVRADCRHYSTRTLPSGDRVERCRVDANEKVPFACPEGCLFFEPRAVSDAGWTQGKGTPADFDMVSDLTEALKLTSICGLGQFAHSPISSVLQHFRPEIEAHVFQKRCPEGVCPMHDRSIQERKPA